MSWNEDPSLLVLTLMPKFESFNFSFWGFNQISTAAFPADDEGSLARRDASFVLLFFFGKFLT